MFASIIRTLLPSETGGKNGTEIYPHCNENSNYVFPKNELRCLSPNLHILVSMDDSYIPRIGPHIFLQQNRQARREIILKELSNGAGGGPKLVSIDPFL
jgi:hypothetical protein